MMMKEILRKTFRNCREITQEQYLFSLHGARIGLMYARPYLPTLSSYATAASQLFLSHVIR